MIARIDRPEYEICGLSLTAEILPRLRLALRTAFRQAVFLRLSLLFIMPIFRKPILKAIGGKTREMPEGLWTKCPSCGEVIHNLALAENLRVCPKCEHHFTMNASERIASLVDPDSFKRPMPVSLRWTLWNSRESPPMRTA